MDKLLSDNFAEINGIFLFYVMDLKSYPKWSEREFLEAMRELGVIRYPLEQSVIERQFTLTNDSTNQFKKSDDRELHRYEFLELIVRLAIIKYKDTKVLQTTQASFQRFLDQDLIPKAKKINGFTFRKDHIYNLKVDDVLRDKKEDLAKVFMFI